MTALPIIEYLDIFKDVLCRFFTGCVVPMVDKLAHQCPEEVLRTGLVPTVPLAAHAGRDAMRGECHTKAGLQRYGKHLATET